MPPITLMNTTSRPAIASPRTNFEAPSIAPKNELSSSRCLRRVRASCSLIRPAERSASIAICLPGMASRLKRAATSAMRPEPLVMTTKFTMIEDREHDDADHEVAAHHEVAERLDDVTGGGGALVPARQDQPRRGEVEREPQHGRDQQHGRESGEFQRRMDEQRRHQDQHREDDRDRQREVEQHRRQRQDQDHQDGQHAERQREVAALGQVADAADPGNPEAAGRLSCRDVGHAFAHRHASPGWGAPVRQFLPSVWLSTG